MSLFLPDTVFTKKELRSCCLVHSFGAHAVCSSAALPCLRQLLDLMHHSVIKPEIVWFKAIDVFCMHVTLWLNALLSLKLFFPCCLVCWWPQGPLQQWCQRFQGQAFISWLSSTCACSRCSALGGFDYVSSAGETGIRELSKWHFMMAIALLVLPFFVEASIVFLLFWIPAL